MRRILLALALVAMATTAASAHTYVWWEMEASNCGAVVVGDHGQGSQLVIEKPLVAPEGFYEFTLVMKMANDTPTGTQGMTAYRTNVWRGPDTPMDVTNPTSASPLGDQSTIGLLNPLGWSGTVGGAVNSGDMLLSNYGRNRASGQNAFNVDEGTQDWIRFVLRINVPTEEFCDWHYIYQTVGGGLYVALPAGQQVFFGSNAGVPGSPAVTNWAAASQTIPVIAIHAVPEPATLALLGLGLLGLIRRR